MGLVSWLGLLLAGTASLLGAALIPDVRRAVDREDFAAADRQIREYRARHGVQPEMLEALSWMARGAFKAKRYSQADSYARETERLVVAYLAGGRKLDADPNTPIALGAALEVQAQVLAAQGGRAEAVSLLTGAIERWRATSILARLRKNLNLLTLEGRPAPPLAVAQWLGPRPAPLTALRGKPVLLFFWAHWCGDCKQEAPVLARLAREFAATGLAIVAPTRHYGYVAGGVEAPREQETRYIDQVRRTYYAGLAAVPVPLSEANFKNYGASTTPTLLLIDRAGVVRLYHPGAMSYDELAARLRAL